MSRGEVWWADLGAPVASAPAAGARSRSPRSVLDGHLAVVPRLELDRVDRGLALVLGL